MGPLGELNTGESSFSFKPTNKSLPSVYYCWVRGGRIQLISQDGKPIYKHHYDTLCYIINEEVRPYCGFTFNRDGQLPGRPSIDLSRRRELPKRGSGYSPYNGWGTTCVDG